MTKDLARVISHYVMDGAMYTAPAVLPQHTATAAAEPMNSSEQRGLEADNGEEDDAL